MIKTIIIKVKRINNEEIVTITIIKIIIATVIKTIIIIIMIKFVIV